jgi:hypothetical protein
LRCCESETAETETANRERTERLKIEEENEIQIHKEVRDKEKRSVEVPLIVNTKNLSGPNLAEVSGT